MAALTKLSTSVWEVVRNTLETSVQCSRQFLFYMKKMSRPSAVALRKKMDTSRFGLLFFSAVNRYSNYFHPPVDYLPTLLNKGFMTVVLGCTSMAMTTSVRGCAWGDVTLTFCQMSGSRTGEWGHVGTQDDTPPCSNSPCCANTCFAPLQGKGSKLKCGNVPSLHSAGIWFCSGLIIVSHF